MLIWSWGVYRVWAFDSDDVLKRRRVSCETSFVVFALLDTEVLSVLNMAFNIWTTGKAYSNGVSRPTHQAVRRFESGCWFMWWRWDVDSRLHAFLRCQHLSGSIVMIYTNRSFRYCVHVRAQMRTQYSHVSHMTAWYCSATYRTSDAMMRGMMWNGVGRNQAASPLAHACARARSRWWAKPSFGRLAMRKRRRTMGEGSVLACLNWAASTSARSAPSDETP